MRTLSGLLVGSAAMVALGCEPSADTAASAEDVQRMDDLAADVHASAVDYGAEMAAPTMMTNADCQTAHDAYDAHVRPEVEEMMGLGGRMDGSMAEHGGTGRADVACMAYAMMDELDRHRLAACKTGDMAGARKDAQHHTQTMEDLGARVRARCNEMMRGDARGSWDFGPMMEGCEDFDGDCGMMGMSCDGGMMGR
jgi:hypothetical protein